MVLASLAAKLHDPHRDAHGTRRRQSKKPNSEQENQRMLWGTDSDDSTAGIVSGRGKPISRPWIGCSSAYNGRGKWGEPPTSINGFDVTALRKPGATISSGKCITWSTAYKKDRIDGNQGGRAAILVHQGQTK